MRAFIMTTAHTAPSSAPTYIDGGVKQDYAGVQAHLVPGINIPPLGRQLRPHWRQHVILIMCYLADAFIVYSNLQLIRLNRGQSPLEQCRAKGPTAVWILSWLHRVPVMYLSH